MDCKTAKLSIRPFPMKSLRKCRILLVFLLAVALYFLCAGRLHAQQMLAYDFGDPATWVDVKAHITNDQWMPPGIYSITALPYGGVYDYGVGFGVDSTGHVNQLVDFGYFNGWLPPVYSQQILNFDFQQISDDSGNAINLFVHGGGKIPTAVIPTPPIWPLPILAEYRVSYNVKVGGQCSTCSSGNCTSPVPAVETSKGGSLDVSISMGRNEAGSGSASLSIHADQYTPALLTPEMLTVNGNYGLEVLPNGDQGSFQQVKSGECLANVVTIDGSDYLIDFYHASDSGSLGGDHLYHPIAAAFQSITVGAASPLTSNVVQLVQSGLVQNGTDTFNYDSNSNVWNLTRAGGLFTESINDSGDPTNTASTVGGTRTVTKYISDSTNGAVSTEATTSTTFSWGEAVTQYVADPAGKDPVIYTWNYYDNSGDVRNGRAKSMTGPWGYWETYDYNTTTGDITCKSQYLDAAFNADPSQCWLTTGSTSYVSPGNYYETVTVQTLMGSEVSRTYTDKGVLGGVINTWIVTAQNPGAGRNDSTNITSASVTNSIYGDFAYLPLSTTNPDGTITLTTYVENSDGTKTTTTLTGAPSSDGSTVVDGSQTVSITDAVGHPISTQVTDIASGLTTAYDIWSEPDAFGRPTVVTHLDGTTEITTRSCCNVQTYTDRFGTTTNYTADALQRIVSKAAAGITTLYTYDGAGRLLETRRQGSDNSIMVQSQTSYDQAGRVWRTMDALGRTTYIQYGADSNQHATITTTYADGGQKIETYYQDGSLYSVTGSAVRPVRYAYGVTNHQTYTKEIQLDASGGDTNEWSITYRDMLGRIVSIVYPDSSGDPGPSTAYAYNQQNQLAKQVDPDGVTTLYQYDDQGRQTVTAIDVEGTGTVDLSGSDEVTQTQSCFVMHGSTVVQRTTTKVYRTAGSSSPTTVSQVDVAPGDLAQWSTSYGLTTQSVTVPGGSGLATTTLTAPDGSTHVTTVQDGLTTSQTRYDANGSQIAGTTMVYDAQQRLHTITDARDGTTTYSYTGDDQIASVTSPAPASGQSAETTAYTYDPQSGRKILETDGDGGTLTYSYLPSGELTQTGGSKSYAISYTYDGQGRMRTMTTCPGQQNQAVTTWNYDPNRGWLTSKAYADGNGPTYTYTAAGRLLTRTWARGTVTTYGYDGAGNLASVTYSDGTTPGVSYTRDRIGEITAVTDGAGSRTIAYGVDGQESGEVFTSGSLSGFGLGMGFDAKLRRTSLSGSNGSGTLFSQGYSYDAASRLNSAWEGTITAAYGYAPNSSLVQSITYQSSGSTITATTKSYDSLDRLVSISHTGGGGTPSYSGTYGYDTANQRTSWSLGDGSKWSYGYDPVGEVTNGHKAWADGTPVAGQQFNYAYDGIGNRTGTIINGEAAGYEANSLNQYSQRDVPGIVEVVGTSSTAAHITVNDAPVNLYGDYFYTTVSVDNSASPVYEPIEVTAVKNNPSNDEVSQQQGHRYVAQTPEQYQYDLDGNLTQDGRWQYTWDGENRLIGMQPISTVPAAAKKELAFNYDYMGRRVEKQVWTWNTSGTGYQFTSQSQFMYDGWNCVAETDGSNNLVRSYLWGNDLSGTPQGAGGVGGLLVLTDHTSSTNAGSYLVRHDSNGNISSLLSGTNGSVVAEYNYGPFGEVIRANGAYAAENPYQFSTKYTDAETGLNYYGCRYYNSRTGRWISRDPLGADSTYAFVKNDSLNRFDWIGLLDFQILQQTNDGEVTQNLRGGIGLWGQPDLMLPWLYNSQGSFTGNTDSATSTVSTGGSRFSHSNCNTVNDMYDNPVGAGKLTLLMENATPGFYAVSVTVTITGRTNDHVGAGGTVYVRGAGKKQILSGDIEPHAPLSKERTIVLAGTVPNSSAVEELVEVEPNISVNGCCGWVTTSNTIRVNWVYYMHNGVGSFRTP
jgi:RHS repeat-associated protein